MKKLTTSVSPFIMLIIPVVLLLGLSLTFDCIEQDQNLNLSTTTVATATAQKIVSAGENSFIKFLLKK